MSNTSNKTATTTSSLGQPPGGNARGSWFSLVIYHNDGAQMVVLVDGESVVIGRSRTADVTVETADLSRKHARFDRVGDLVWVEDLKSTNGTLLGGACVERMLVRPGDEVVMGSVVVVFHSETSHSSPRATLGSSAQVRPVVESAKMQEVYATVDRVARTALPVMVYGETGTGKELVARALHEGSDRSDRPLVVINCAAIPRELIESLLFGHERGAFTGAHQVQKGVFEEADGSTLFLDEIGELSSSAQSTLLRVLETKKVTRVGSNRERSADVRVVTATNRDLEQMCEAGTFRRDLFYRLNALAIDIPPLRERTEEIGPLAQLFIKAANEATNSSVSGIGAAAIDALHQHVWPGNVRELRNTIDRAVVLAQGGEVEVTHLPRAIQEAVRERRNRDPTAPSAPAKDKAQESGSFGPKVRRFETDLIIGALQGAAGNKARAARNLRIPLTTLKHKLATYEIPTMPTLSGTVPASEESTVASAANPIMDYLRAAQARGGAVVEPFRARVQAFESGLIRAALVETGWNKTDAARHLDMPLRTLQRKIQAYAISEPVEDGAKSPAD